MLGKLFSLLKKEFEVIEVIKQKPTARCPFQYVVKFDEKLFLVVIAKTNIQKFYLNNSLEKQKEFYDDFKDYYEFNFPIQIGEVKNFSYAIYPYIENLKWANDEKPIEILNEIYQKYAKEYNVSNELISKIEIDFLSAWPQNFHSKIKKLPLYKEYFSLLKKEKSLIIYKEHSDYAINNILYDNNKNQIYLMDFEFSKSFQMIGHDLYHYNKTLNNTYNDNNNLSKIKRSLIDNINDILDKNIMLKHKIFIKLRGLLGSVKSRLKKLRNKY